MRSTIRGLLATLLLPAVAAAQSGARLTSERLQTDLVLFAGFSNGNVLAILADSGTLLVDAQSARRVGLLDSALAAVPARPVRMVVNTHYHGDHLEGNAHFAGRGARLIAHANVPAQARKDTVIAEWENWHRTAADPKAIPATTFADSISFRFGAQDVHVYHVAGAHTDGDAVVWLPHANVLHLGDIFELQAPPFVDWWAGGSLHGMIAAIDRFLPRLDDRTRVVPGHGPVADRATLVQYRDMLATLLLRVEQAVAAGRSLEETCSDGPRPSSMHDSADHAVETA
jgi:cyclase